MGIDIKTKSAHWGFHLGWILAFGSEYHVIDMNRVNPMWMCDTKITFIRYILAQSCWYVSRAKFKKPKSFKSYVDVPTNHWVLKYQLNIRLRQSFLFYSFSFLNCSFNPCYGISSTPNKDISNLLYTDHVLYWCFAQFHLFFIEQDFCGRFLLGFTQSELF